MPSPRIFLSSAEAPGCDCGCGRVRDVIAELLRRDGCEPISAVNNRPGMGWLSGASDAISSAHGMILIISRHALESEQVALQLAMAEMRDRRGSFPILPVLLPDVAFTHLQASKLAGVNERQIVQWPHDSGDIKPVWQAFRPQLKLIHAELNSSTLAARQLAPGEMLRQAKKLADEAQQLVEMAVATEREKGTSWETIGEVLDGVTKSAAQKRYGAKIAALQEDTDNPGDDPFVYMHGRLELGWANIARTVKDHDTIRHLSTVTAAVTGTGSPGSADSTQPAETDWTWRGSLSFCPECHAVGDRHLDGCFFGARRSDDRKADDRPQETKSPSPPSVEDRLAVLETTMHELLRMSRTFAQRPSPQREDFPNDPDRSP